MIEHIFHNDHGEWAWALWLLGTGGSIMLFLKDKFRRAWKKIFPPPTTCLRCGSPLKDERCTDPTCPFQDYAQNDKRGWKDHPEFGGRP